MKQKQTKKSIWTFATASFLNDLGSDMIYPVWPIFLTAVLGANMAVLGFIDGLGDALVSISQAASGYISDRIRKRKVFVWLGYLMAGTSRIGYAFSTVWQHLIPFRILDRAGKMRGAPRDAIIADLSMKESRGKNFGLLRAMDNFGAVCGIVLCLLLVNKLGYRNLFLLAAIPSLAGALLIFAAVKENREPGTRAYTGFSFRGLNGSGKLVFFLSALFALGAFSYSFLLVFAKKAGFPVAVMPVLYLVFTVFAALFSLPFGRLADKMGRKGVLALSYLFWMGVCAIFIFSKSLPLVVFSFVLYGLHKAAWEPVQRALVSELVPQEHRASVLGAFQMVIGSCALPASVVAGLLWDKIGAASPFCVSLALTVVSMILLAFVKETEICPG